MYSCSDCKYISRRVQKDWMMHNEDWRYCKKHRDLGLLLMGEQEPCLDFTDKSL